MPTPERAGPELEEMGFGLVLTVNHKGARSFYSLLLKLGLKMKASYILTVSIETVLCHRLNKVIGPNIGGC